MPNYCENDLTVRGPKEVMEEFLKFAAGGSPFDFNRFLPYPEEFRRLDEIAKAWDREHEGGPDYDWFGRPKDGFNSGGYEWRVKHWGTKWPACRVKVEGPVTGYAEKAVTVFFHFDTAWSPPKPVIEKAAELYPALQFELRYFERGAQFNGFFYCSDGEVETDEWGPYFGDRGG
jgi:Ferredoxin-like domain in Api92-like protein